MKELLLKFSISTLMVLVVPVFGVFAWTTPMSAPPGGNTDAPLNTGSTITPQIKNGDLSVEAFAAFMDSYFALKIGVGTLSFLATLDVTPTITAAADLKNIKSGLVYNGGSPMANYYGAYIAAPTGSGSITNKYALVTEPTAGKVGFGTVSPTSALSIAGGFQVSDDTSVCTVAKAGSVRWHTGVAEVCTGFIWTNIQNKTRCEASGGAPMTAVGGSVTTNSVQSVPPYSTCPPGDISTCTSDGWSPAPQAYAYCGVEAELIYGCRNISACNYDENVNTFDGDASCIFRGDGCSSEPNNCNDTNGGIIMTDCTCSATERPIDNDVACVFGCTSSGANNYNAAANTDDGSCTYDPTCANTPCSGDFVCDDSSGSPSCSCPAGTFNFYYDVCAVDGCSPWWDPNPSGPPC